MSVDADHSLQLRYRLTRDGYREHLQVLSPLAG
jgi:hypothetical protein